MSVLEIGDMVYCDGVTGVINEVDIDDNGQPMGFTLKSGERLHHYNLDMMMEDVNAGSAN
jgi:hypothetical protein